MPAPTLDDDEGLDRTDADHVQATVETHGYTLLVTRLRAAYGQHVASLRRRSGPEETNYERGFLDALDLAMRLPRIIVDETRSPD